MANVPFLTSVHTHVAHMAYAFVPLKDFDPFFGGDADALHVSVPFDFQHLWQTYKRLLCQQFQQLFDQ